MRIIKSCFMVCAVAMSVATVSFADNQVDSRIDDKAILAISDFHFDPFYSCQAVKKKPCPLITQLRQADPNDWATILQKHDKQVDQYNQDTNYRLLNSALTSAKKAAEHHHVKFVMMLGDVFSHEYRDNYKLYSGDKSFEGFQAFVKKTQSFLVISLADAFPSVDIFPVVGNNDGYAGDYNPSLFTNYYKDSAPIWSDLIDQSGKQATFEKQFAKAGYYAVDVPGDAKLRLIVLNSVLFSYKAKGQGIANAANEELAWLRHELATAAAHSQKAYILMHIPPSYDIHATPSVKLFTLFKLWHEKYINAFTDDLNEYNKTIAAVFVGHLHSDFQQMHDNTKGDSTHILGTPSISPIFGNDPAFKVFFYDPTDGAIKDSITYTNRLSHNNAWVSML